MSYVVFKKNAQDKYEAEAIIRHLGYNQSKVINIVKKELGDGDYWLFPLGHCTFFTVLGGKISNREKYYRKWTPEERRDFHMKLKEGKIIIKKDE